MPTATAVVGGPGTRKLVADPQWGAIASQAWQRVTDGSSLAEAAAWLTEQGVLPPRAGSKAAVHTWNKQNVQEWLTNPRLIGVLVERSIYEACRHTLKGRSSPKNPTGKSINKVALSDRVWPLQGVARCAFCGSALAGSVSYGRGGNPHYYLRCIYRLKGKGCTAPDIVAGIWEDAVIELLVKSAHGQGELLAALEEEMKQQRTLEGPARERLSTITLQRDSIHQRLDRLIDLVASGDAVGKSVAPKIAELQLAIDACDHQRATCEAEIAAASMTIANAQLVLDHWRTSIADLVQQPPDVKRRTIMAVLKEAHLGLGKDIRLVFWPLGSGGDGGGGELARPNPSDPNSGPTTGPNTDPSTKTTTAVGSDDGRVWRTNTDYVRTVSFMSQMFTRQEGRAHRWIIDGSPLMSAST